MSSPTDAEIAAFFARGGKVQKVAIGAESGFSNRDWRAANRGERTLNAHDAEHIAERRAEVASESARAGDRHFAAEVAAGFHDRAFRR